MPTKRRKIGARAVGRMNRNQRDHLISGFYFWTGHGEDEFQDEAHRRATWEANRYAILAGWDRPGRRPVAMWEYDFGLEPRRWPREWSWPEEVESEADMVYHLLEAGQLEGCHLNGAVRIESEIEAIEADWRHEITYTLTQNGRHAGRISGPLPTYGTPTWLWNEHAPAIAAKQAAEREAYYRQQRAAPAGTDDAR